MNGREKRERAQRLWPEATNSSKATVAEKNKGDPNPHPKEEAERGQYF